jgi:hypothetical protein
MTVIINDEQCTMYYISRYLKKIIKVCIDKRTLNENLTPNNIFLCLRVTDGIDNSNC